MGWCRSLLWLIFGVALVSLAGAEAPTVGAPTHVSIEEMVPGYLHVQWDPVPQASVYEVNVRRDNGPWMAEPDRVRSAHTFLSVDPAVDHVEVSVRVVAGADFGPASPPTAVALAGNWQADLHAVASGGTVSLTWKPRSQAEGYQLIRYTLTGQTKPLIRMLPTKAGQFVDQDVLPGVRYYYQIRSWQPTGLPWVPTDLVGVLVPGSPGPRNPAEPVVGAAPPGPAGFQVRDDSGLPRLSWTGSAAFWEILRREVGGSWQTIESGIPATRYLDSEAEAGKSYEYRVVGRLSTGAAAESEVQVYQRASSSPRSLDRTVRYRLDGYPEQSMQLHLADLDRPVRAVMIVSGKSPKQISKLYDVLDRFNVAVLQNAKFNAGDQGVTRDVWYGNVPLFLLDCTLPSLSSRHLAAALQEVARLTSHPEVLTVPLASYGFSKGTADMEALLEQDPWSARVVAMIDLGGLGQHTSLLPFEVPTLFQASSGRDWWSSLFLRVSEEPRNWFQSANLPGFEHSVTTWDDYVRSLATYQQAPVTVLNGLASFHGDNPNLDVTADWLRAVLSQALASSSVDEFRQLWNRPTWRATYQWTLISGSPWNRFLKPSVRIMEPRLYAPATPSAGQLVTWLPSGRAAQSWKDYAEYALTQRGF